MKQFLSACMVLCMFLTMAACTPSHNPASSAASDVESTSAPESESTSTSESGSRSALESQATATTSGGKTTPTNKTKPATKGTTSTIDRSQEPTFQTKLPALTYPLRVGEAADADSGKKGTIYVVNYKALCQEGALKGERYRYDISKFLTALQGLVNREKPTLYIMATKNDYTEFLYVYMRQKDSLLYGYKRKNINTLDELVTTFKKEITKAGIIAWDEMVPATVNTATIACGVDGYIPVRYSAEKSSLYHLLTNTYGVSVKVDLHNKFTGKGTVWGTNRASTGSPKNDAYVWAIEKYMSKTSSKYMGYAMDAASWNGNNADPTYKSDIYATCVPNTDYFVARKAFVFDLYMFQDDIATDEPKTPAGTDYKTLIEILSKQYKKHQGKDFTQVTGFPPIETKYTSTFGGKYDAVMAEFETVQVFTAYNCTVDADCPGMSSMFNGSVYMHFPLKSSYKNNKPASIPKYDKNKKYIMFYMGDADSSSWITRFYTHTWQDESRGDIPLAFPYNPNLSDRIPVVFDYFRTTATKNDYFIAGDSGSGYVNPTLLVEGHRKHSKLPDALDAWVNYNKKYYNLFDISITGFVLNGLTGTHTKQDLEAYSKFSPDGIAVSREYDKLYMLGDMPVIGMYENYTIAVHDGLESSDPEAYFYEAVQRMENCLNGRSRKYPFYAFRNNLTTPTFANRMVKELKKRHPEVEVVDPYTFYGLIKKALT